MNDIMDDYSYPNDLEIEKRISFYEHTDFQNEVTALLIPDTVQYVHKIFHCMRWATQYRKIVEDVCNQISDCRLTSNQLCQSIEYKVGTLGVDGRAYAQKISVIGVSASQKQMTVCFRLSILCFASDIDHGIILKQVLC